MKKEPMLLHASDELYEQIEDENTCRKMVSLYVMAPTMLSYVSWVLDEAMKKGTKRLYFLARDGYSMYSVARIICEKLNLPIECRYLHCSRFAWRSAEFHLMGEKCLDYVCLGGIDVTLRKVMHRAGLDECETIRAVEELRERVMKDNALLQKTDADIFTKLFEELTDTERMDTPMSYRQVKELRPVLAQCEYFMERMKTHAAQAYPNVCGYLTQEGFLDGTPWALVDSGWTGSMQKSLMHILKSMGYEGGSAGYYFGMYEMPAGEEETMSASEYYTWYFAPHDQIRRKVYFANSLFECIFSSPEGMTVAYKRSGTPEFGESEMEDPKSINQKDKYIPVLEKEESPNAEQIVKSTQYLETYTEQIIHKNSIANLGEMRYNGKVVFSLLRIFMGHPTLEEAEEYGKYVFCDDVIGEETQVAAAPLSEEEIKENYFCHKAFAMASKKGKPVRESAWLEGSMVRRRGEAKAKVWHSAFYKYILYLRKNLSR